MHLTFDAYLPELFRHEGGFVDHPKDPGGATNWGITLNTLQSFRGRAVTKLDVRNLTKSEAGTIYRQRYWNAIRADDLPAGLDALAFDIAVNHGVGRWRQWAPLAKGLSAEDAIRAITERRRKFYRSLPTFSTFGKGWMRRANSVEAWALKWAEKHGDEAVSEPKPVTMAKSTEGNTAIITTAVGALAPVNEAVRAAREAADGVSGIMAAGPWVIIALMIVAGGAYIWWRRRQRMQQFGV